jgi:hypothetical protein
MTQRKSEPEAAPNVDFEAGRRAAPPIRGACAVSIDRIATSAETMSAESPVA